MSTKISLLPRLGRVWRRFTKDRSSDYNTRDPGASRDEISHTIPQLRTPRLLPRRLVRMLSSFCLTQAELRLVLREEYLFRVQVRAGYDPGWLQANWRCQDPRLRSGRLSWALNLFFWRAAYAAHASTSPSSADLVVALIVIPTLAILYVFPTLFKVLRWIFNAALRGWTTFRERRRTSRGISSQTLVLPIPPEPPAGENAS